MDDLSIGPPWPGAAYFPASFPGLIVRISNGDMSAAVYIETFRENLCAARTQSSAVLRSRRFQVNVQAG